MRCPRTISASLLAFTASGYFACSNGEGDPGSRGESSTASGGQFGDGDSSSGDGDGTAGDGDSPSGDGDDGGVGSGGALWVSGGGIGCEDLELCGATGEDSCCARSLVPGGTFPMGLGIEEDACPTGQSCGSHERPEHEVTISPFELDVYEVTVGRFRAFVGTYDGWTPAVGDGAHPLIEGSGFQSDFEAYLPGSAEELKASLACDENATWTNARGDREAYPQNCVNWALAFSFCIWDGGRLPTEAEWEFAAAGGAENRLYAWGEAAPNEARASYFPSELSLAGSHAAGVGRYGHHDLSGHVWEWTLDWLDTGWYSGAGATCEDCARVTSGTHRVLRGGAYSYEAVTLRSAARSGETPDAVDSAIGFRCAYDQ